MGIKRTAHAAIVAVVVGACTVPMPPGAGQDEVEVVESVSAPLIEADDGRVYVCYPYLWGSGYYLLRVSPWWVDFYLAIGGELPEEGRYFDGDGDGYGDPYQPIVSCYDDPRYVSRAGDCNDWLASVNPAAEERCDRLDNECDGRVDEGCEGVPAQGIGAVGVCLCGWPELTCTVDGEPGPTCASAIDCADWCTGGLPTCAPGPGEIPPECEDTTCSFVDPACPEPSGVCLCGWPELMCTVDGEPGPACASAIDCGGWCRGGLPTCAPGPGELPPECEDTTCSFVDPACPEPSGVCLCGWPELMCTVDGEPGPACASAFDCGDWCRGGLPTCAPGPGKLPPECEDTACSFVDPACPEPSGVCLCGFPELMCTVDGEPGPSCASAFDCGDWCRGGLPTCAPGPGELPPECADEPGCSFVDEACPAP